MISKEFDDRLTAWGKWLLSDRVYVHPKISSIYRLGKSKADGHFQRSYEPPMQYVPINDIDCDETDEFIKSLEEVIRDTLLLVFTSRTTRENNAKDLRISKATLYARLEKAEDSWRIWREERRAERKSGLIQRSIII